MNKFSWLFEYKTGATNNGETGFKKARYTHELPVFKRIIEAFRFCLWFPTLK